MPERYESYEAWLAEGIRRFGPDKRDWRFVCPSCGFEQSVRDYKAASAPLDAVAFSCVGRWREQAIEAFGKGQGPCNYAGGGLFKMNPVTVIGIGTCFAFAPTTSTKERRA